MLLAMIVSPPQLRPPTLRATRKENDRPGIVLDQLLLDLPDQLLALSRIGLDRLLIGRSG
jgi:hypothetical protein